MRLACQEGLVPGSCLAEKLDRLAESGYEGMEFSGWGLAERKEEVLGATAGRPVKVSSICAGFRGSLVDSDKIQRDFATSDIKDLLSLGGELGAVGVIAAPIFGGPRIPDLSPYASAEHLEREVLVELLMEIAAHAEKVGCAFLLEPLNRYETHLIKTLQDGVSICERVNSPGVKVMADFFHMSIEEQNMAESIERAGSWVAHVHLADSTRLLPGYGHTDWAAGMSALKKIGFTGYMVMECGVPGDAKLELKRSADLIKALL